MTQILSEEDIQHFNLHGYVRLTSALDRTCVQNAMEFIWDLLEQRYDFKRYDPDTWNGSTKGLNKRLQANRNLWSSGDKRLITAITQILGPNWRRSSHWGTLLYTAPEHADTWNVPTGWHWDSDPFESIAGREGVFIFTFLTHVQRQGGGTLIVEGSHELSLRFHRLVAEPKM